MVAHDGWHRGPRQEVYGHTLTMHDQGQSDRPVVPTKSPNNAGAPAAEGMEGRGLTKGNPSQQNARRAQHREGARSALERVREGAERDKMVRSTTLLHHIYDVEHLRAAYHALKRDAAPGIDGETWQHYGEALEANLADLSGRLARGAYRAKPVRRAYIPKTDGRQRPLGIPTLEDKMVQRTTAEVLNGIYETDFLGFSYGFRPGRKAHDARDALYRTHAPGEVIVVRYADDFIVGFQHRAEAERFLAELRARFAQFGLELHPEKTRWLEFGPYAAEHRGRAGQGKPETFNFLGFTHICGKKRNGRYTVVRQTIRKMLQAKLSEVKAELRRRLHDPIPAVGTWLRQVVGGHIRYYEVPMNSSALHTFRYRVAWLWQRALTRRSHTGHVSWERMRRLIDRWLPPARICHPYPLRRLGVIP